MFKENKQFSLSLSIIIILGFVSSLGFILHSISLTENSILSFQKEKINLSVNREDLSFLIRLKIPKINVDALIEDVGVASDGTMDVPQGPTNVGWYKLGPRPGGIGSAVIAGHYGWKDNTRAVFDDLNKLQKGDKVYVEDEEGKVIIFVVREIRKYDLNTSAEDVFNSNDGKAHLNLITCEGIWNEKEKGRPNRLIVFTDRE